MKRVALLLLAATLSIHADEGRFKALWYNGNAEISTYSLVESRYGEPRNGYRIMVFVTELMRLATHIKPDVKCPDDQMIRVIKLNDLRKFTTGIYEYSVMTSVFASVEQKAPYANMSTMKVSFSSQEWCGQVFDRLVRTPDAYQGVLYSYFESEGEAPYVLDAAGVECEDNLWTRTRELNGPLLKEGETMSMKLIPSRWINRKLHAPTTIQDATITKGKSVNMLTALGTMSVVRFEWKIAGASTTVHVESKYPHRIMAFTERDGSSGKLIASRRSPYWQENKSGHRNIRTSLGLPD